MTAQIYKYPIEFIDEQTAVLCGPPISAIIQDNKPVIYAPYSANVKPKKYKIRIVGIGHKVENLEAYTFLQTVQYLDLVFHIFYRQELDLWE
ncbi:MAG: hypothetical protein NC218_02175 [Acetobacter sp.]|nr:hypothetical protein [Acetobacter sp.]